MGYEITYKFHPRKEGGYDTENKQEKTVKVGKPFDDTPLEKCAAAILAQLARRDIWVVDVEVSELVKKKVSFKESTDGKGIVLKNKKFSFSSGCSEMVEEEAETPPQLPPGMHPHELLQPSLDSVYSDPNRSLQPRRSPMPLVNQKRVLYEVFYDPEIAYLHQAEQLKLKFTREKRYPVHAIVPHPQGRLDLQKIVVTDDTGKAIQVDERFFTTAGRGLLADNELGFSSESQRGNGSRAKLMYDGELGNSEAVVIRGRSRENLSEDIRNLPLDDGTLPESMLAVPDIRKR